MKGEIKMYYFKEDKKEIVLKGRSARYLAENKLFINESYLSLILNGKRGCSKRLAQSILNCISIDANLEDYFKLKA